MISFAIERRANDALASLPDERADQVLSAAGIDPRYRIEFWSIAIAAPLSVAGLVFASLPYIRSFPPGSIWRIVLGIALLGVGYLIARYAYPLNRARLAAAVFRVLREPAP
jgi:hypothetical protein